MKKRKIDSGFWIGIILLSLLLFKNPFSGHNIISDLEPSPDTIHYLNPVQSFINGHGLKITYQGRQINTNVPPLYSLVLVPPIWLFKDIRAFYFTNLILVFSSTWFFYQIISQLIKNKTIKILVFLSFITSTIIYWYPQIAMAENMLITLFLLSIWLLLKPLTTKVLVFSGLLATTFYGAKYTALTLTAIFLLVNLIKIKLVLKSTKQRLLSTGLLAGVSLVGFLILNWIEYLNKGSSILSETIGHFIRISTVVKTAPVVVPSLNPSPADFSLDYLKDNFLVYLFGVVGGEIPVAGKFLTLIPTLIGFIGLAGLFINSLAKKTKNNPQANNLINLYLLLASLTTFLSISFFTTNDARYIFILFPCLFLSAGIFLDRLIVFFNERKRSLYSDLIILFLLLGVLLQVINPISKQLQINFQTGEKALNFETVQGFNDYFDKTNFPQKPFVVTTLPPYFVDFYTNHTYEILPLSQLQYFSNTPEETWGIKKGIKFNDVYREKITQDTPLFISDYRTKGYFYNSDFTQIRNDFNTTPVKIGCEGQCNIYQLDLK